jgi:hypothetical protein
MRREQASVEVYNYSVYMNTDTHRVCHKTSKSIRMHTRACQLHWCCCARQTREELPPLWLSYFHFRFHYTDSDKTVVQLWDSDTLVVKMPLIILFSLISCTYCVVTLQLKMVLIKCCDISNEVRPMEVSEPWVDCLLEEYFNQVGYT